VKGTSKEEEKSGDDHCRWYSREAGARDEGMMV